MATVTKTDGGKEYARGAYLIGEDDKPSTWKVRIEETPGNVTTAQLGAVAAALSPEGYRGNKLDASAADIASARTKLRALYTEHKAAPPESLKANENEETVIAAEINGEASDGDLRSELQDAICSPAGPLPMGQVLDHTKTDALVIHEGDHHRVPFGKRKGQPVSLGAPVKQNVKYEDASNPAVKAADAEPGTMAFVTDLSGLTFSEGATVAIEVCRDGTWKHPTYGDVSVTPQARKAFADNFTSNVRKVGELPLDYDHKEGAASGWIKGLRNEGKSLFADVMLTEAARAKVAAGEYRFFSPEFHPNWKDPETGKSHGHTLFGGGLTNRPFFRGMAAIQCSEASAPGAEETTKMPDPIKTTEEPAMTMAEAQQLREEVASLRLAEERRTIEGKLGAMTFSERVPGAPASAPGVKRTLAPASRKTITDLIVSLPQEFREPAVKAFSEAKYVELGERGSQFSDGEADDPDKVSAERIAHLKSLTPEGRADLADRKKAA